MSAEWLAAAQEQIDAQQRALGESRATAEASTDAARVSGEGRGCRSEWRGRGEVGLSGWLGCGGWCPGGKRHQQGECATVWPGQTLQ